MNCISVTKLDIVIGQGITKYWSDTTLIISKPEIIPNLLLCTS